MYRAVIAIACAACGASRPAIAPPSAMPLDDVRVRLDQQAAGNPAWQAKPRWQYARDVDVYEPATATATTPLVILLHDAGGHRRELGELARHLARHGVRAIVPAIDYDDPDFYAVVDAIAQHRREQGEAPTIYVGHGAGAYVAARLAVQSSPRAIGSVLLAPALPPGVAGGKAFGYAGDDNSRLVQLDVERATGRCDANGSDTTIRMVRNYRTRARLESASYCGVIGDASCAARCGGAEEPKSFAAFEAVARVVTAWTTDSSVGEAELLAATPTTKDIEQKTGQIGSDEWAMPSVFAELGGAIREDDVQGVRGVLGIRLDSWPFPTYASKKVPAFARNYKLPKWGMGGYGEVAWQHDDLKNDDLRIAAGFAFAHARGDSFIALGLGAHVLLGQHGLTVGADATLHFSPFLALRVGTTYEDPFGIHGSLMVTVPGGIVAILIPFLL